MKEILTAGSNCWTIAAAARAAFVIDGEAYFAAVREAIIEASETVFLIGWDIHSKLKLVRDKRGDDYPDTLAPLLERCAREKAGLDIYILSWDFAMIYSLEREFFPSYKLQWRSHHRIHFCLDGAHPVGASQHQKLVVVDDRVAFAGGLDLSQWRWDTREHKVDDPRRKDPSGNGYPPFHDIQMAVSGEAAACLGEVARDRWQRAGGCDLRERRATATSDPWPPSLNPDLCDIDVGIARTMPAWEKNEGAREIEQLYVDSIAAACSFIYIENQYLSSSIVGDALVEALAADEGPEVVIVMPHQTGGWLEQHTMDVLRSRLLGRLREADRHDRLRVYSVRLAKEPPVYLMVHAKIMVVDDHFVRIGSSNISNRSMGLDSECDLAIEHNRQQDCCKAITAFRRSLLAEHLGVEEAEIAALEAENESLIDVIESLQRKDCRLEKIPDDLPAALDTAVPDSALLDPEKPLEPAQLFNYIVGSRQESRRLRQGVKIGLLLVVVLAMAAAWRWTPLADLLNVENAESAARWVKDSRFTPALVLLAFTVGSLLAVPVTLMIVATITVFGPWLGLGYSLVASELAALVTFWLGNLLGRDSVRRLAGSRLNGISRKLARPGLMTIIALRIIPVAPFTVINVVAGASELRLRDFALGTLIGMLPGIVALSFLAERLLAVLRSPDAFSLLSLVGVAAIVMLSLAVLRRWLRRER